MIIWLLCRVVRLVVLLPLLLLPGSRAFSQGPAVDVANARLSSAFSFVDVFGLETLSLRNAVEVAVPLGPSLGLTASLGGGFDHDEAAGERDFDGTVDLGAGIFLRDPEKMAFGLFYDFAYEELSDAASLRSHDVTLRLAAYLGGPGENDDLDALFSFSYGAAEIEQPGIDRNFDSLSVEAGAVWYLDRQISLAPFLAWFESDPDIGSDQTFIGAGLRVDWLPGFGGGALATHLEVSGGQFEIGTQDDGLLAIELGVQLLFPRVDSLQHRNRQR